MKVSLSFDNGPDPEVTPAVLDVLDALQIPASFFVLGSKIESTAGIDLVKRAKASGHRVGNHTYSHTVLFGSADDQSLVIREIDRTQSLLGELGGERWFRPFGGGGNLDARVMSRTGYEHLKGHGYSCVLWNCIPRDWEDPVGWPARALADIRINPWSVVVLHDIPTGAMDSLDSFIRDARAIGAEFVIDLPEFVTPLLRGDEIWSMCARGLIADR